MGGFFLEKKMTREKLINTIENYIPFNEQEEKDKQLILSALQMHPNIFERSNLTMHMTASGWVVNQNCDRVLMAYHKLYDSWAWMGGHADGEEDLLKVALKEVKEESGLSQVTPLSQEIFSLEILTVDGHEKKGQYVPCHLHFNITYLLQADDSQALRVKEDENSAVGWFGLDEAIEASSEPWFQERIYSKLNQKLRKFRQFDQFKIEEISDQVFARMQGKSFPADCKTPREELRYLTVLHMGFDGEVHQGELVLHESIAAEILDIMKQLYLHDYPIEQMHLIDDYDADDLRSMGDNNSSAFCYRVIANTDVISEHGKGLAIDINPLYNPYVTSIEFTPVEGEPYLDREQDFPHKLCHEDLCYQLFAKKGYVWGGDWPENKDYQHFQKNERYVHV